MGTKSNTLAFADVAELGLQWGQVVTELKAVRREVRQLAHKADFDESQHPRADDGRFGSGSSSSSAAKPPHDLAARAAALADVYPADSDQNDLVGDIDSVNQELEDSDSEWRLVVDADGAIKPMLLEDLVDDFGDDWSTQVNELTGRAETEGSDYFAEQLDKAGDEQSRSVCQGLNTDKDAQTAANIMEHNHDLEEDGSDYRVVPDPEGTGKIIAMLASELEDQYGDWTVLESDTTGQLEVQSKSFKSISGMGSALGSAGGMLTEPDEKDAGDDLGDLPLLPVPDCRQEGPSDCAAGACCSVGMLHGVGPGTVSEWAELLGTTEEGTDANNIVQAFTEFGCPVEARDHMGISDLAEYRRRGWATIVSIQDYGTPADYAANEAGHYVVVIGVSKVMALVFIQDPNIDNAVATSEDPNVDMAPGRVMLSVQDFLAVWHDQGENDPHGPDGVRWGIAIGPPVTSDEEKNLGMEDIDPPELDDNPPASNNQGRAPGYSTHSRQLAH